ncbi:flagellar assembly protein FliH [Pantoea sp. FN0302]|uniref:flagellar assembly protein FliH n=1 Tax=unclassified Pantoea TaxID=2630326 RepID=UPI003CF994A7
MSDAFSSRPWQRWQPDDLTRFDQPDAEPQAEPDFAFDTSEESEDFSPQSQLEQMQTQARLDAHAQGYAEGQQKGFNEGRQAGFDAGFQQGLAEAQQQQAPVQARMQQLVTEFQHTLEALDSVIASRLLQLALEAARQVIGQATAVDGSALLRQIQQMIQQEPMFSGKPQLRVHPDDLQRVEQTLGPTLDLHGWRLLADSSLHPGGCKLSAEDGDLDASVATRWHELCRLAAPGEL